MYGFSTLIASKNECKLSQSVVLVFGKSKHKSGISLTDETPAKQIFIVMKKKIDFETGMNKKIKRNSQWLGQQLFKNVYPNHARITQVKKGLKKCT